MSQNSRHKFPPTTHSDWVRGDEYHNSFLIKEDEDKWPAASLVNSDKNGLPSIAVSKAQGKYLKLLIKALGAKRVLEIGTLGGYSAIWMAQALPEDGELVTLEYEKKHAEVAAQNIKNAGVPDGKVKIIVGAAADSLKTLEPNPPFDFVFIDADSQSVVTYYKEAKRLTKSGGVIIVDNVNRHGRVSNPDTESPWVDGLRDLLAVIKNDPEAEATTMGMAGQKGYDAYMFIVKN